MTTKIGVDSNLTSPTEGNEKPNAEAERCLPEKRQDAFLCAEILENLSFEDPQGISDSKRNNNKFNEAGDKANIDGSMAHEHTMQASPEQIINNEVKNTDSPLLKPIMSYEVLNKESSTSIECNMQYPEGKPENDSSLNVNNTNNEETIKNVSEICVVPNLNNKSFEVLDIGNNTFSKFEEIDSVNNNLSITNSKNEEDLAIINNNKSKREMDASITSSQDNVGSESDILPNVSKTAEDDDEDSDSSLSYDDNEAQDRDKEHPRPPSIAGSDLTDCSSFSFSNKITVDEGDLKKYKVMRGREYYNYYSQNTHYDRNYYDMYENRVGTLPRGGLLHFKVTHIITREDVKKALKTLAADIAFIDFNKGEKEGWIRLKMGGNTAKALLSNMIDQKYLKIGDAELEFRPVTGKEEIKYLKKAAELQYLKQNDRKSLKNKLRKRRFKYVTEFN